MSASQHDAITSSNHNDTKAYLIDESDASSDTSIESSTLSTASSSAQPHKLNRVIHWLNDLYRTTWRQHAVLSWFYRSPKRHSSRHEYHLAHLAPTDDTTHQAQQRALQLLALANHFYVLPSIGYFCANAMYAFVDNDTNGRYSAYDETITLYSSILTFVMSLVFLFDALLYYFVIIVQRSADVNKVAKTHWLGRYYANMSWELVAEILNIIAAVFYCISGILGLPAAVTQINNLHISIDIDRVANACDNIAMLVYVFDSFIYLYIWSAYQPAHARWYRSADRDADWWAQTYNMFGSFAYLFAVLYGAVVLYDPEQSQSVDWEAQYRVDQQRQQLMQLAGDMMYIIGSIYQEVAFYTEMQRATQVGLVHSGMLDRSRVTMSDDAADAMLSSDTTNAKSPIV